MVKVPPQIMTSYDRITNERPTQILPLVNTCLSFAILSYDCGGNFNQLRIFVLISGMFVCLFYLLSFAFMDVIVVILVFYPYLLCLETQENGDR